MVLRVKDCLQEEKEEAAKQRYVDLAHFGSDEAEPSLDDRLRVGFGMLEGIPDE